MFAITLFTWKSTWPTALTWLTKFSTTFEQIVFAHWLQGWDQSYFMALFFFISGYFTPSSLARKGISAFVADKCKRLGMPFLIYVLVLGPALNAFAKRVLFGESFNYSPDPMQTWFLAWLLIFNFGACARTKVF